MDYCFVTSFYDIGRSNWNHFNRSTDTYLNYFRILCQMKIPLIIFIDKKYYQIVEEICNDARPDGIFTNIIPIDDDFLTKNIESWNYRETEEKIMNSELYKRIIKHRSHCPETNNANYTCINHAKIDFIKYAIDNNIADFSPTYYGWVDFGYIRDTNNLPNDRCFTLNNLYRNDNVYYLQLNEVGEFGSDPYYNLIYAPEIVSGGFFIGSRSSLLTYSDMYKNALKSMHSINIADDDQAVILYVLRKYGNTLQFVKNNLLHSHGWMTGFLLFNQ